MEAIKKKMQAMKVEKDNACDRVDVCEEQCKAARVCFQILSDLSDLLHLEFFWDQPVLSVTIFIKTLPSCARPRRRTRWRSW